MSNGAHTNEGPDHSVEPPFVQREPEVTRAPEVTLALADVQRPGMLTTHRA
jgi:hypothetical protein